MPRLLRLSIRNGADTPLIARLAIAARVVAAGQLLDLDDVGAHVGEQHAARRARHDLRELEHAHAGERAGDAACSGVSAHRPTNAGLRLARNAA